MMFETNDVGTASDKAVQIVLLFLSLAFFKICSCVFRGGCIVLQSRP